MLKLINDRGYSLTHEDRSTAQAMKEKFGYVAMDCTKESEVAKFNSIEKSYELPDGQVVTIGEERFLCAEPLFQPSFLVCIVVI
jgi:actin